jgi:hypothetical protein
MKLLQSIKKLFDETPRFPEIEGEWHGAGILFTSHNTVLVGYKIVNDNWQISGFGGKRNEDETYYQTAIRETLEELYEVPITNEMIDYVVRRLEYTKVVNNNGYILIICKLSKITEFMLAAVHFMFDTPLYETLPYSATALIGERNDKFSSEFHYLGFMSTKLIVSKTGSVDCDPNLISDMEYIS